MLKIMNLLGFFLFWAEKVFSGPDSMGFVWGRMGQALMQFMQISAIFAISPVLATLATPVVPILRGSDSMCLLGYKRSFSAACNLPYGRPWPV